MAHLRECACGMTATAVAYVALPAVAVEALSGATPTAVETVEIPLALLSNWGQGPFARDSDDGTRTVWHPPTYRRQGPQPKRPFPPWVCEMCRDPHIFLTRNSYNLHLKKVHAGVGAFFSAAQDRMVFRRRARGQVRLRGNLAGRQGFVPWPVPPSVTARPISPSPELNRLLQEATAWDESVTAMRRRMRAANMEAAPSPPLGALPLGRGCGLLAQAATTLTEHLVSVVSELGFEPRGAPGCPAVALPRQQPMLDSAVAVPGSALASPVFPTATNPTLLPGDCVTSDQL